MNLPAIATSFLRYFERLIPTFSDDSPIIICYLFVKGKENEPSDDPGDIVRNSLGFDAQIDILNTHPVRSVAPNKLMYCVSFKFA